MNNTEQHPYAAELLAYVDGQLDAQQVHDIELLLQEDASACSFVKQLKQSQLPFKNAFDPMLTTISNSSTQSVPVYHPHKWRMTALNTPVKLVAGLIVGLIISLLYNQINTEDRSDWIVQVAEYQRFYVRNTVESTNPPNTIQTEKLRQQLSQALGSPIKKIPDLTAFKLTFMRGQILEVNNQPLIQLVYLPENGKPIALCITPNTSSISQPVSGNTQGMSLVHWRTKSKRVVLIGNHPVELLMEQALAARNQLS
ncbi:MAG: hypothetical protein COA54_00170 [Thiotrichaceae bacterium]|nr:MAG: hypothetical protein COA54_00170 [Thiotrichaceae bacterium]